MDVISKESDKKKGDWLNHWTLF